MASTWTTDDLAALESAIKKSVKIVWYKDGKVEYNSLAEMLRLRILMQKEIGIAKKTKRRTPFYHKGLG